MTRRGLAVLFACLLGIPVGVGAFTFVYAKGFSYLSPDPQACVNCHVMNPQYDAWLKSGHRHAATCVECHLPHAGLAKWTTKAEHGFRHTAVMHSKNLDSLSRMAREIDCSIFVKNGPNLAGLGYGGEGFCSFTIASPTGEGLTGPISFSRIRRCTLVDSFRIV